VLAPSTLFHPSVHHHSPVRLFPIFPLGSLHTRRFHPYLLKKFPTPAFDGPVSVALLVPPLPFRFSPAFQMKTDYGSVPAGVLSLTTSRFFFSVPEGSGPCTNVFLTSRVLRQAPFPTGRRFQFYGWPRGLLSTRRFKTGSPGNPLSPQNFHSMRTTMRPVSSSLLSRRFSFSSNMS